MTWPNVLALAVFVCVCGFIAYWGDILGRRMGKRRLTIFGLRPRYTAIMTTTVTGMLIAIITMAVMATVSQRVKLLMLQGVEIIQKYQTAREESAKAMKQLKEQRRVAEEAREAAEKAVEQRDILTARIAEVKKKLEKLRADLARKTADLAELKREIAKREKEIERLESLRARLDRWRIEVLAPQYRALLERPIIFGAKEEIARRAIRCDQPRPHIKQEVLALLDEADNIGRSRGAKVGRKSRSVEVVPVKVETGEPGEVVSVTESQIIDAVVDNISKESGSVVVLVVSMENSVEGEPALVNFVPYRNVLVYSAGGEIADTTIDGSLSRGQILGSLVAFLQTKVRDAAMAVGVIPHRDEEGQLSVGTIDDWDQVFDLVDRVRAAGRPVRVKAIAKKDTWSADSLSINLVVGD